MLSQNLLRASAHLAMASKLAAIEAPEAPRAIIKLPFGKRRAPAAQAPQPELDTPAPRKSRYPSEQPDGHRYYDDHENKVSFCRDGAGMFDGTF